jgi:uncharacterized protein YbbC (DUF1343 family)
MAMLITNTNEHKFVPAKTALVIWQIMNKERKAQTRQQAQYVQRIKRVYIPREYAPASYIKQQGHLFSDYVTTAVKRPVMQSRLPYKD